MFLDSVFHLSQMQSNKVSNRFIQYLQYILTKERSAKVLVSPFTVSVYIMIASISHLFLAQVSLILIVKGSAECERSFCFLKMSHITELSNLSKEDLQNVSNKSLMKKLKGNQNLEGSDIYLHFWLDTMLWLSINQSLQFK